jgi:MOSC domain-containing protein
MVSKTAAKRGGADRMANIQSIYRYPVKGLTPEPMARALLAPGQTIPGDRLYAIENGPSGFDPAAPSYLSKTHFLMLMKNERLANLRARFDQDSHRLTITLPSPFTGEDGVQRTRGEGQSTARQITADLCTAAGRAEIENFFAEYCGDELRGPPRVLYAEGYSFSDVARKVVSLINLASVAAVETMVGATVDPLRFRGNVYVEGWPPWSELDLVGRVLKIGSARLKVVKRIVRCAATNVDPVTGIRDLNIPQTLMRNLDHADCGIYAEVIEGGEIAAGDAIETV